MTTLSLILVTIGAVTLTPLGARHLLSRDKLSRGTAFELSWGKRGGGVKGGGDAIVFAGGLLLLLMSPFLWGGCVA